jgi:hypothetical protein
MTAPLRGKRVSGRRRQERVYRTGLWLQAIGREGSPTRGFVAPVDHHREEKE